MQGRTWKNIEENLAEEIKNYLLDMGATEQEVKSVIEDWRVRLSDSTFTFYKKGTLYSTPSKSKDPLVFEVWNHIDSMVGSSYVLPTKDYLIGLDETGKGEVIGHMVLTGVVFPSEIFEKLDHVIGPADTKKRHNFKYWDSLFMKIDAYRKFGLNFLNETIPPWHVDTYNINKIMDVVYQRILSIFFREVEMSKCRIVLDDYGLGTSLKKFFNFLEKQGTEVVVTHNADETYLEAKIASLISKRAREEVIKRINENPEFQINGLSVGTGNAGDPKTVRWLEKWHASGKPWPWFVKRSFRIVRQIENKTRKVKKIIPPIREELMSRKFIEDFEEGKLSIQSLSINCPHCGKTQKAVSFAIFKDVNGRKVSGMKCPSCKKLIDDAGITLRYYCGYVVPDSNIIRRRLISQDLESSRFFEDFTVLIPAVVWKECDVVKVGKEEFKNLARYASMGRIKLKNIGRIQDIPEDITSTQRDEMIIETALKNNAILITGDNTMKAYALSKEIFTIFI
ncbi:hypothetical protein DRN46_06470 [Thermococci archaeon]|nr:MAG: hypothetical protein DRN46_06470 [Thermococci archaeon]